MNTETKLVRAEWWNGVLDLVRGEEADLEVERDDNPGRIAIHTFVNGEGSKSSYYLDRESAIAFARNILEAVVLR